MSSADGQPGAPLETDARVVTASNNPESHRSPAVPSRLHSSGSLEDLIAAACDAAGVSAALLAASTKARIVSDVRARIAAEAVRSHLATLDELGALFGRSASAVSKLLQRHARLSSDASLRVRLESGVSGGAGGRLSMETARMSNTGTGQECPTPAPIKPIR
jgi:hypothetical protein